MDSNYRVRVSIFLSTYINKIDGKGRVSVPAGFRSVIAREDFNGIVVYPSFVHECVEACGMKRMEKISNSIDAMDPYSEERDAFASSILGESEQLGFDPDGRVTLTEKMIEKARLKDKAMFVGKGQTFEIWDPAGYEKYARNARDIAKQNRGKLSLMSKANS
jgi:MraZ protein